MLLQHLHLKENLGGLTSFSIARSKFPEHTDPMLQGFMKKVRLGGLFSNKRKGHVCEDQEQTCIYCGQLGTIQHRVYCCPATEHVRQCSFWAVIKDAPKSLLLGGLFPHLQGCDEYFQLLDAIHPPDFQQSDDDEVAMIFTDGSAQEPGSPVLRLCAWSVTKSTPAAHTNKLLYSGLLPGRYQTVFRAELYAVAVALATNRHVHIRSDNLAVVRNVNHIMQYGFSAMKWAAHPDRDILRTVANTLQNRQNYSTRLDWVKAHRGLLDAVGSLDLWEIYHNDRADHWAGRVFHSGIPPEIMLARKHLATSIEVISKCVLLLQLFSVQSWMNSKL